jgi:transposase-like protein
MPAEIRSPIDGMLPRERLAASLLARGKTCRAVAIELNITERTLYKWRKRPAVQRAIFSYQQELIDSSAGQSISVIPDAVRVLSEIVNDPEARAADRIAASRALMHSSQMYQERKMLERTIRDLEDQLYGLEDGAPPEAPEVVDPDFGPDLDRLPSAALDSEDAE